MYLEFTYQMQMVWLSLFLLFHICSLQNEYHMYLQWIILGLCLSCFSEYHHGWNREKNVPDRSIKPISEALLRMAKQESRKLKRLVQYQTIGAVIADASCGMDAPLKYKKIKKKIKASGKWGTELDQKARELPLGCHHHVPAVEMWDSGHNH